MPAETPELERQKERKIRVEAASGTDADELVSAVAEAYEKFYLWDIIISQAELDSVQDGHSRETPRRELSSYRGEVAAEDDVQIEKIQTSSATALEVTGVPGPLERLVDYFQNRQVDWDRNTKEPSEDRRLELETQRANAVREDVELLHGLGFPEIQIREALSKYIYKPLDRLERYRGIRVEIGGQSQS